MSTGASGVMRTASAVAVRDLRERSRDRTAYLLALVVPLIIVVVITFAFGRSGIELSATFAVADEDGSELSDALLAEVLGGPDLQDVVAVEVLTSGEEVRRHVESGEAGAGVVIPAGFGQASFGAEPMPITVYRAGDAPVAGDVAEAVVGAFVAQINTGRVVVATRALATGQPADPSDARQEAAAAAAAPAITAEVVERTQASVSPVTQFAPAMGVFFMFFAVGGQAQSVVAERRQGTWARMLASPVRRSGILLGKAGSAFVLGALSLGMLLLISALVLGAEWGSPFGVALLVLTTAFAVTGVFALILAAARTPRQVEAAMSFVVFGFALLGGNFVSLTAAPELLQRLSLLTPNGWALRGFADIAASAGDWTVAWPSYLVLTATGAACFLLAAARAERLVSL